MAAKTQIDKIRLRFAPSPTGMLHAGNARIAILNFLFAKQNNGEFLLRIDDTDTARSQKTFEKAIINDLKWLGLAWQKTMRQSERMHIYAKAADTLRKNKRLYPCYETPDELALARKLQLKNSQPPIYNRDSLLPEKKQQYILEGRKPHFRFKLEHKTIAINDLCRGESKINFANLSDPVLLREDGTPLYTLTSVVDDGECSISHIVRGEDHVTNSAAQSQLFEALGFHIPLFAHLPLMRAQDNDGPLSKREGSLSLQKIRESGEVEAQSLFAYLARLGTARMAQVESSQHALAKEFSFRNFGRASPIFDLHQLAEINRRGLAATDFNDIKKRLASLPLLNNVDQALFWETFRGNITHFDDLARWADLSFSDKVKRELPPREIRSVICEMLTASSSKQDADNQLVGITNCEKFLHILEERLKLKGAKLYRPLRLALLGCPTGPEVARLFILLGQKTLTQRLCGENY